MSAGWIGHWARLPSGWGAMARGLLVGAVAILLAFMGWKAGLRWDPFGLGQNRLERAEARATLAEAEARARTLEVQGEREQRVRLDIHQQTVRAAEAATAVVLQQTGSADDASVPLEPARAARLVAHDRELCRIAVDLDGCAAATEPG
ncbi:MAG: hypothetical protein ACT6RD_05055 [Brevundimonas sp.]|uniref:hypothetical protein n=1 Tax=Brevundimonas sp. TaxID=1871086 RepID=UPI0040338D8E